MQLIIVVLSTVVFAIAGDVVAAGTESEIMAAILGGVIGAVIGAVFATIVAKLTNLGKYGRE